MSHLTSDHVNYLVFRYLQEAGFVHSAYTFAQESFITSRSDIKASAIPPGMLISLLQKGIHYTSIEFHLNDDGTEKECAKAYSLFDPHVCSVKKEAKESPPALPPKEPPKESIFPKEESRKSFENKDDSIKNGAKKRKKKQIDVVGDGGRSRRKNNVNTSNIQSNGIAASGNGAELTVLRGHASEIISCAWCPTADILASVSGDSTARLWFIGDGKSNVVILPHVLEGEEQRDVTTLDWSPDGMFLATGCYDGRARIWTQSGTLVRELARHRGPIFSLKWSPSGKHIATAGLDQSTCVWDATQGTLLHAFENHTAPALDVDWQSDRIFASCSTDRLIHVYDLEQEENPIRTLIGHSDEVNSIRWSPDGLFLASCSDDHTAKIWDSSGTCLYTLNQHTQEIYTLKWNSNSVLATASFDCTVCLWNTETGTLLHMLKKHTKPVYAITFSPDGRYLASGSLDETLIVWTTAEGQSIASYSTEGNGGIFEVGWSAGGDRLAACTSGSAIIVIQLDLL